jgi:hypothetical protein
MSNNKPRALGVLLCYNDADILEDQLRHLLENNHDLIAWDHGSDDETAKVLDAYNPHFVERRFIPRSFDFYRLYQAMSVILIKNYIRKYDWITWPDQDEILEGPSRDKSLYEYITEVYRSPYTFIDFRNYNYWLTDSDDRSVVSPVGRVRHYSRFDGCPPRIRSWRASVTNIRLFNHNPLSGQQYPEQFNLRHYPARTWKQIEKRIFVDRANLRRGLMNLHYEGMKRRIDKLRIPSDRLHYDDGKSELNPEPVFDWKELYGYYDQVKKEAAVEGTAR